ncbi:hypothetical protein PR048_028618 [Dryococelus australis]|uniref:Integrase zinc-binding domain-containing protein n=1 Tax=Dryococelus australis TaxID=614101 RepID=A0ABQ9GB31_9NEOP|nr:hypothetical protein PR048_028618 [Dryococelus australis]
MPGSEGLYLARIHSHNSKVSVQQRTQLRTDILGKIHEGHMGIVKCRRRAQESVWWLITTEIKILVENCKQCLEQSIQHAESLQPNTLPGCSNQQIGSCHIWWQLGPKCVQKQEAISSSVGWDTEADDRMSRLLREKSMMVESQRHASGSRHEGRAIPTASAS